MVKSRIAETDIVAPAYEPDASPACKGRAARLTAALGVTQTQHAHSLIELHRTIAFPPRVLAKHDAVYEE
jgi:hypothetical protein